VKTKLDENLPERLVAELAALEHDVDTARAEHLAGRPDNEIWQAAQAVDRFLITQDLDFSDVRRYVPGTHGGLLLVRLAQPGRAVPGCPSSLAVRDGACRSVEGMPGGSNRSQGASQAPRLTRRFLPTYWSRLPPEPLPQRSA